MSAASISQVMAVPQEPRVLALGTAASPMAVAVEPVPEGRDSEDQGGGHQVKRDANHPGGVGQVRPRPMHRAWPQRRRTAAMPW